MERALPLSDDTQAAGGKTSRQMPFSRRLRAGNKINRKSGRLPRVGRRGCYSTLSPTPGGCSGFIFEANDLNFKRKSVF